SRIAAVTMFGRRSASVLAWLAAVAAIAYSFVGEVITSVNTGEDFEGALIGVPLAIAFGTLGAKLWKKPETEEDRERQLAEAMRAFTTTGVPPITPSPLGELPL